MHRLIWLLGLFLIAIAVRADSPYATIPYDELHDMQQKAATAGKGLEHIRISSLHVTSSLCGVKAADIHLYMQPAGKPIMELPLADNSHLKLPMDPALYKENPLIISNQPRRSLRINTSIDFLPPTAGASDYRTLMADVDQINTLIHREAGMLSWFAPKAEGLIFLFAKAEPATLTIHTPKGDTVMQAEASPYAFVPADLHIIQVKYDKDLYASNPAIDLSVAPKDVMPLMDLGTMKKMSKAPDEKKCTPNPGQKAPASTSNSGPLPSW
ncbi:MAG: DUF2987 domain-containing protein [Gammaproteobacteria bacterium]